MSGKLLRLNAWFCQYRRGVIAVWCSNPAFATQERDGGQSLNTRSSNGSIVSMLFLELSLCDRTLCFSTAIPEAAFVCAASFQHIFFERRVARLSAYLWIPCQNLELPNYRSSSKDAEVPAPVTLYKVSEMSPSPQPI